jgi:hypothetical protein
MNKALISLAVISSLMLFVVGCTTEPVTPAKTPGEEPQGEVGAETAEQEISATPDDASVSETPDGQVVEIPDNAKGGTQASEIPDEKALETPDNTNKTQETVSLETGITGSITEIDTLDSELSEPDIELTQDYLEEIDW